jgi:hypothetical protein
VFYLLDLVKVRLQTVGKHWDGKPPTMGGMFKHILKIEGKHHNPIPGSTAGGTLQAQWCADLCGRSVGIV